MGCGGAEGKRGGNQGASKAIWGHSMIQWIHLLPPVGEGACSTAAAEERLPFLARMVDTYESLARKVFPLFLKGAIGEKIAKFCFGLLFENYNPEYHDITDWLILHGLTCHWPTVKFTWKFKPFSHLWENPRSKGPSAAPTLPGNPVFPPCTDRPRPATKNILTSFCTWG